MATKKNLQVWILEALKAKNGSATLLEICKYVWDNHEDDLRRSGDLFYTWQYDIRWAATNLRENGKLLPANQSPRGIWELDE
jgi:hypothetical protein